MNTWNNSNAFPVSVVTSCMTSTSLQKCFVIYDVFTSRYVIFLNFLNIHENNYVYTAFRVSKPTQSLLNKAHDTCLW